MKRDDSGPLAIFGIRIKTIVVLAVFGALLLVAVNRSEIESLLRSSVTAPQQPGSSTETAEDRATEQNHLVVDQEMLTTAMREVQIEKLAELESKDSTVPTDRFFYVVELVSGGDLEGVDLTIEPDQVILISEGGTKTTIDSTSVKKIHKYKLPPSKKD